MTRKREENLKRYHSNTSKYTKCFKVSLYIYGVISVFTVISLFSESVANFLENPVLMLITTIFPIFFFTVFILDIRERTKK